MKDIKTFKASDKLLNAIVSDIDNIEDSLEDDDLSKKEISDLKKASKELHRLFDKLDKELDKSDRVLSQLAL